MLGHTFSASAGEPWQIPPMQPVTQQFPISVTVAFLWAKHGPRACGAVARAVGRWQRSRPQLFIKTLHGAAPAVDYDNLDVYANIHNNGGCWDANVMRYCKSLLRPNEVFYDIGANAGVSPSTAPLPLRM